MMKRVIRVFSFLGGATAWFIHLLLTYAIAEGLCVTDGTWFVFLGLNSTHWLLIATTVLTIAMSLFATGLAWRHFKLAKNDVDQGSNRGTLFFNRAAVLSNLFFIFVIMVESVPIFFLGEGC